MDNTRLKKTDAFLRQELMKLATFHDNTPRMAEYRIEHSYRVANIGIQIARAEGLDEERTFIACLLHDVGYSVDVESKEQHRNHGRCGAAIARPFLLGLGYPPEAVEEMCYGIAIHVDDISDFDGERTPLALTVGDADNIDRFDAYRLYETLHFRDYMNLPLSEQEKFVTGTLEKLVRCRELPFGTQTATALWQEKLDYQIGFYSRLLRQIENSSHYNG